MRVISRTYIHAVPYFLSHESTAKAIAFTNSFSLLLFFTAYRHKEIKNILDQFPHFTWNDLKTNTQTQFLTFNLKPYFAVKFHSTHPSSFNTENNGSNSTENLCTYHFIALRALLLLLGNEI